MTKVIISLRVMLPYNYNEIKLDALLSDVIYEYGGQVIESEPYQEIDE